MTQPSVVHNMCHVDDGYYSTVMVMVGMKENDCSLDLSAVLLMRWNLFAVASPSTIRNQKLSLQRP
eukprot:scaffold4337_cov103-Skeletonema_marinoi.AAC.1